MYNDYGREIYQELQQLNDTLSAFYAFFQTWADGINTYWDRFIEFSPLAIQMILVFIAAGFVLRLFFPKWGA